MSFCVHTNELNMLGITLTRKEKSTKWQNNAKGTTDPGVDCFNQFAYSVCFANFQFLHILQN